VFEVEPRLVLFDEKRQTGESALWTGHRFEYQSDPRPQKGKRNTSYKDK
jgi:hypothetical protein